MSAPSSNGFPEMISGASQRGLCSWPRPRNAVVRCLLSPKSVILQMADRRVRGSSSAALMLRVTSTFGDFKSQWTIGGEFLCSTRRPSAMSSIMRRRSDLLVCRVGAAPASCSAEYKLPPDTNSITAHRGFTQQPIISTMLRCLSALTRLTSLRRMRYSSLSLSSLDRFTLTATSLPRYRARKMAPNPPCPIRAWNSRSRKSILYVHESARMRSGAMSMRATYS
mmetsp:Transcript_28586/g.71890  ORF Transcript_28586/g.71890 Transcript_28586/m.71890 type:complete len:224 (-) Transcript_28586:175-846(-)